MRKIVLCGAVCALVVVLAVPQVAQAQVAADAHRSRLVARQENARQRVQARQAEIRAKVAAVMAAKAMPVVVSTPIPTAKPTPAPTAAPASMAPQGATGTVQDRIRATWPGDDGWAIRTTGCETGRTWNPYIVSRTGKYKGLWQMDDPFWANWGGLEFAPSPVALPADIIVERQTEVAARGFYGWNGKKGRGAQPWECG